MNGSKNPIALGVSTWQEKILRCI